MAAFFSVEPGIPADWSASTGSGPAVGRERWIRFGMSWYPGEYHTFSLRTESGECAVALGGTVLELPGPVARRDPYHLLAGHGASAGFHPEGPHPWRDIHPAEVSPCLLLMYPYYKTFLVGRHAGDPMWIKLYIENLILWAISKGIRSIALLYLTKEATPFIGPLSTAGFSVVNLIDRCDLEVSWKDFDGYLASLPSKRRIETRREQAQIRQRALTVAERPLAGHEEALLNLRCQLVAKYDGKVDRAAEAAMLASIKDNIEPSDITVFTVADRDCILNFTLFIQDDSEWTAMLSGTDYTRPDSSFGYFETVFYQPAAQAPDRGIRQIGYGPASVAAKRRRGCQVSPCLAAELRLPVS